MWLLPHTAELSAQMVQLHTFRPWPCILCHLRIAGHTFADKPVPSCYIINVIMQSCIIVGSRCAYSNLHLSHRVRRTEWGRGTREWEAWERDEWIETGVEPVQWNNLFPHLLTNTCKSCVTMWQWHRWIIDVFDLTPSRPEFFLCRDPETESNQHN